MSDVTPDRRCSLREILSPAQSWADFQQELTAIIPQVRVLARSLCRDASRAEDLAQDALTSAWKARASYKSGTNMKAWVQRILRNKFYTEARRAWRSTPLDPQIAEATLISRNSLEHILELDSVRRAFAELTEQHREALILVGVGGFSYEEAAERLQVPIGTIKSRVCRARQALTAILDSGDYRRDGQPAAQAFDAIVAELAAHPRGHEQAEPPRPTLNC